MKKELRRKYLDIRETKDIKELKESSEKIIKKLEGLDCLKTAKTVMVYVSFKGEVKTHGFIKDLLRKNVRVCVPLCNSTDCTMTAREIKDFSDLKEGSYGILEPCENSEIVAPYEIDFIVVPGCAFSRSGHRIGYGKGYYDRFLENIKAKTCGLCYDFSLVGELPYEKTDIPLDFIITENEIIKPEKT